MIEGLPPRMSFAKRTAPGASLRLTMILGTAQTREGLTCIGYSKEREREATRHLPAGHRVYGDRSAAVSVGVM